MTAGVGWNCWWGFCWAGWRWWWWWGWRFRPPPPPPPILPGPVKYMPMWEKRRWVDSRTIETQSIMSSWFWVVVDCKELIYPLRSLQYRAANPNTEHTRERYMGAQRRRTLFLNSIWERDERQEEKDATVQLAFQWSTKTILFLHSFLFSSSFSLLGMCCRTRSLELSNFNPKRGDRNNRISRWTTRVEFLIVSKVEKKRTLAFWRRWKRMVVQHIVALCGALFINEGLSENPAGSFSKWMKWRKGSVTGCEQLGMGSRWIDSDPPARNEWMAGILHYVGFVYFVVCVYCAYFITDYSSHNERRDFISSISSWK